MSRIIKERLNHQNGSNSSDDTSSDDFLQHKLRNIKSLHSTLLHNIDHIKTRTSTLLQSQERDLLSAFQTRLLDINNELYNEKQKNDIGSSEWILKCQELTSQLHTQQQQIDVLQNTLKGLRNKYIECRRELKLSDDTKMMLVKQLVTFKRKYQLLVDEQQQGSSTLNSTSSLSLKNGDHHVQSKNEEYMLRSASTTRPSTSRGTRKKSSVSHHTYDYCKQPSRPSTAASSTPSSYRRPFTASIHNTITRPSWSREFIRPSSASVNSGSGGMRYSQSVHQRSRHPEGYNEHTNKMKNTMCYENERDDNVTENMHESIDDMEKRYKQLLAIANQQNHKLQRKIERLSYALHDEYTNQRELVLAVKQHIYRVTEEEEKLKSKAQPVIQSILSGKHRISSSISTSTTDSGMQHTHSHTNRPVTADVLMSPRGGESFSTTTAHTPSYSSSSSPSIESLSADKRSRLLQALSVEKCFWSYIDSMMGNHEKHKMNQQGSQKQTRAQSAFHYHNTSSTSTTLGARLNELMRFDEGYDDSDDHQECEEELIDREYDGVEKDMGDEGEEENEDGNENSNASQIPAHLTDTVD